MSLSLKSASSAFKLSRLLQAAFRLLFNFKNFETAFFPLFEGKASSFTKKNNQKY